MEEHKLIKVTNGWTTDYEIFSEATIWIFNKFLDSRRELFVCSEDAIRGERFTNDSRVLLRLQSMFSEQDFLARPQQCIDAALLNCAKSDRWYAFEKDWGNDDNELYDAYGDEGNDY